MQIANYLDILSSVKFFEEISKEDIDLIFKDKHYSIKSYSKNSIIHLKDDDCKSFDIILSGDVVIQKIDEDGSMLTITSFSTGDVYACNLLFSSNPVYPMNVISKTDVTILHITKDFVLPIFKTNEQFLLNFITCISDKTYILTKKIDTIALKSARKLILHFLKVQYDKQGSATIKLPMSKKALAQNLGIQRTSLSRELSKMKRENLIDFDAKYITVKDLSIL